VTAPERLRELGGVPGRIGDHVLGFGHVG
jgi:hypothetical protein